MLLTCSDVTSLTSKHRCLLLVPSFLCHTQSQEAGSFLKNFKCQHDNDCSRDVSSALFSLSNSDLKNCPYNWSYLFAFDATLPE